MTHYVFNMTSFVGSESGVRFRKSWYGSSKPDENCCQVVSGSLSLSKATILFVASKIASLTSASELPDETISV